jgi:hypothetical protein
MRFLRHEPTCFSLNAATVATLDRVFGTGPLSVRYLVHNASALLLSLVDKERGMEAPPNFMFLTCERTHIAMNLCLGCKLRKFLIFAAVQTAGTCPSFIELASMLRAAV